MYMRVMSSGLLNNLRLRFCEVRKFNYIDLGREMTAEALRLNWITKEEYRDICHAQN